MELPLHLERAGSLPVVPQLVAQLRTAILGGQVQPGARLPSTRTLARILGISRGAVVTAYDDLLAAGYLVGRVEAGTYVSAEVPVIQAALPEAGAAEGAPRWLRGSPTTPDVAASGTGEDVIDFRVGQPAVTKLSDAA